MNETNVCIGITHISGEDLYVYSRYKYLFYEINSLKFKTAVTSDRESDTKTQKFKALMIFSSIKEDLEIVQV